MKLPNFNRTFFIDRSFGGHRLAGVLRKVGIAIEVHKDHFPEDEDDDVWIPDVQARGWIIFSSDKRIARDPLNVKAVLTSKAQVIMSTDNNTLPEIWGAAFITGRVKIGELLDINPGPVFISLGQHCSSHIQVVKEELTHPRPQPQPAPPEAEPIYLDGPLPASSSPAEQIKLLEIANENEQTRCAYTQAHTGRL